MTGADESCVAEPNLDNVVVVLSHTTEPGNIGSTCRAMKTMGLRRLRLICPLNPKGRTATAFAHGAEDVLAAAEVVDDLTVAVSSALVVCGTTARQRQFRKHALMPPAALADRIVDHSREGEVVLLFGTERTGLTNDEIDFCRYMSTVPTAGPQHSLNLGMAVMLYSWEIRQALLRAAEQKPRSQRPPRPEMSVFHPHRSTKMPTQFDLDTMYSHLAYAMEALDYSEFERRKFLTFLRQLHMRAGIVDWELQIYHLLARRIVELSGQPRYKGM